MAAFRAGPGYQYQVDQATDAVARKASALGMLGSGNTAAAISDRAGHMADQEYDRYLGRLDGLNRLGYDATGRQAGVLSDRADLFTGRGRDRASVYGDATRLGVSTAQHTADGAVSALHGGMMAGQNAAANRFGAIMGGLQLGSKLLGGAAGGGGLGRLGSLFG
ncbi:hypothetical protein [Microvirga yunnanensis]|uniref:hypothetical protein n=1 Tax=Microvirga yunnanensis TaxID=2953740 RepID=UPI0021C62EDE|nr:hypothetical protein [Microvirga sp. HBU65207]